MPASPCIAVCQIDRTGQHCLGCGRTLDEIARWPEATDESRRAIKRAAKQRLKVDRPGFLKWLFTGAR